MPSICCVPNCKGNYRNGPRVSVFAFPKDELLKKKWLSAIHRDGFYPTPASRVCELHFKTNDIERETSQFDSKSGKLLSAPLKYPRLVIGAIPTQMPNCASYMSSSTFHRENPEIKKMKLEQQYIEKALQYSITEKKKYDEIREFKNLDELKQRISLVNLKNFWNIIHKENKILFVNIELNSGPEIALSVVINDLLEVTAFVGKTSLSNIPNISSLPIKINNINNLNDILEHLPEMKTNNSMLNSDIISQIHGFMDNLNITQENLVSAIEFIKDS